MVLPPAGKVYTFIGANAASWNDSNNWTPSGIPGPGDVARIVTAVEVDLQPGIRTTVAALSLGTDAFVASTDADLEVLNNVNWRGGGFLNVRVVLPEGAQCHISGPDAKLLLNSGFDNRGSVRVSGTGILAADDQTTFTNYGLLAYELQSDLGAVTATNSVAQFGQVQNYGKISLDGGALLTRHGFFQFGGQTDLGRARVSNGSVILQNAIIVSLPYGAFNINGGVLTGSGTLRATAVRMHGGTLLPGHSPGVIDIVGDFVQDQDPALVMEIGGRGTAGIDYDQLRVSGAATFAGKLDIRTINGFVPANSDTFPLIVSESHSGSFSSVSSNAQVNVTSTGASATLTPNAPNPPSGQPLNIATRMSVQTGDNVLIAGFIVTGPAGSTKKVLIRGLGPSLTQFGVPNTLSDPLLELHNGNVVTTNDNWQQGDTSQIPTGFAPSDPREAVIVATLAPGNYSAVVKGAHGETGVGIAEVYDLDAASPAKLANISTRGFINTGDDVMIGGFIVGGSEPAKILVRAIGPTLTDFGVPGALADPTLELHDSNGMTISNDDWRESQETEIVATTIPPSKDREPAILATLVPGNYTAVVRGKNNTTGVGLVEAYNLQ
jgi:hypothetical protein